MDKTETFIKMCEKAVEIQAMRYTEGERDFYDEGDWFVIKDERVIAGRQSLVELAGHGLISNVKCSVDNGWSKDRYEYPSNSTWLPRQDQLQAMIRRTDIYARPLVAIFAKWVHEELDYILLRHLISMEQLWLAFVMKEKHNKTWNGEDWVKAK